MRSLQSIVLALSLSSSFAMLSCSQDQEKSDETTRSASVEQLIQAVQGVETDVARGFLLRSATPRVKSEFTDNLYKIRAASYLLRANPLDRDGLAQLHMSYKMYESLNLIQDDRTLLENFISTLRGTIDSLSSLQGLSLDGFGEERQRTLFTHNFNLANDIGDFQAITPAQNRAQTWKVTSCGIRCGNLEYLIGQVEKAGDETWLLSPVMTLPDRDLISLFLEGSARGPLVDIRGESQQRRFQVLIAETDVGGMPRDANAWQNLSDQLVNYPGGKTAAQFRSFKIELNLAAFKGKTVTIALRLRANDSDLVLDRSDTMWQLNKFTLEGKGTLALLSSGATHSAQPVPLPVTAVAPPAPRAPVAASADCAAAAESTSLYHPSVDSLGEALVQSGEAAFVNVLKENDPKFIKFSGRIKVGEQSLNQLGQAWMISAPINTAGYSKVCLGFDSAVWFYDAAKPQTEVVVSFDYAGDPKLASWQTLNVPKTMYKSDRTPNGASLVRIANLALSELLKDKPSFVLAFRYSSDETTAPWWGISNIEVTGKKLAE